MRHHQAPPAALIVVHAAMGLWLLLASARRMALDLDAGLGFDWVTITSALLGLFGTLTVVPSLVDALTRQEDG